MILRADHRNSPSTVRQLDCSLRVLGRTTAPTLMRLQRQTRLLGPSACGGWSSRLRSRSHGQRCCLYRRARTEMQARQSFHRCHAEIKAIASNSRMAARWPSLNNLKRRGLSTCHPNHDSTSPDSSRRMPAAEPVDDAAFLISWRLACRWRKSPCQSACSLKRARNSFTVSRRRSRRQIRLVCGRSTLLSGTLALKPKPSGSPG